jgi:sugar/nucleoside kinase (ribokinase family)
MLGLDTLKKKQVDADFIIVSDRYKTGATIVLNYVEDRAMITHPGAMTHLTSNDVTRDILIQSKHVHISSVFLQPGIQNTLVEILGLAKELNLTTSLDAQWDPSEKWDLDLPEILPLVDVFLPNIQELLGMTQTDNIDQALKTVKEFSNILAVKMGNKGSLGILNGKKYLASPFLNSEVVDAIGAGDSFNAGFIYKFLTQAELSECLQYGNLMGAINTTAPGGTDAFDDPEGVKETARKRFNFSID